jgi:hypothetical protein
MFMDLSSNRFSQLGNPAEMSTYVICGSSANVVYGYGVVSFFNGDAQFTNE